MARRPFNPLGLSPDEWVTELVRRRPSMAVPHWLIACYLYYELDDPLLSDGVFDGVLVSTLEARGGSLFHPHHHLIPWDLLKTGLGVQYPDSVKGAALAMLSAFRRRP